MKPKQYIFYRIIFLVLAIGAVSSCEDESLNERNQELRLRIVGLEEDVELLEIEVGEDSGDNAARLQQANEALKRALENLDELKEEDARLEVKHAKLEKEIERSEKKYRIKK